ncbi:hypothetical protein D3C84_899040 [compost metagenome]
MQGMHPVDRGHSLAWVHTLCRFESSSKINFGFRLQALHGAIFRAFAAVGHLAPVLLSNGSFPRVDSSSMADS